MATFDELEARIAALEAKPAVELDQLPLRDLTRWLQYKDTELDLGRLDALRASFDRQIGTKRIYGPFDAGVSGAIATQTDVALTVLHNQGITGTQYIVGTLYDGSFAGFCSWRSVVDGANQFRIFIANLRAGGNSTAGWRGWVITS